MGLDNVNLSQELDLTRVAQVQIKESNFWTFLHIVNCQVEGLGGNVCVIYY